MKTKIFILVFVTALSAAFFSGGCGGSNASSMITILISPLDGSSNVGPDQEVTATFSAPVTEPSDWAGAFILQDGGAGPSLCTSVSYDQATLTSVCGHDALQAGKSYTASVAGIENTINTSSTFTIGAGLALFHPGDGSVNVDPDVETSVHFAIPVNAPADWSAAFTLRKGDAGASLCTSVNYDAGESTATCEHETMIAGGIYTLSISGIEGIPDSKATFIVANVSAAISPSNGTSNADLAAVVSATFSNLFEMPADPASVFTLKQGGVGASLCTSVAYDQATLTAVCNHGTLLAGTTYTAAVSGITGVTDTASIFTTGNGIVLFQPGDGQINVGVTAPTTAHFTVPFVVPADWNSALTLKKGGAGSSACTSVSYDAVNRIATCAHDPMVAGVNYTLAASGITGIPDSSATFLVRNSNVVFSPADGATGVDPATAVAVTFASVIDAPPDWSAVFTLTRNGAGPSLCTGVTYDAGTRVATCVHDLLIAGAHYRTDIIAFPGANNSHIAFTIAAATAASSVPVNGSIDADPAAAVTITFSGPIDDSLVSWLDVFILHQEGLSAQLCTSVSYNAGTLTATCEHVLLGSGVDYVAEITGVPGVGNIQVSFETQ